MDKNRVAEYFDRLAPHWDDGPAADGEKIGFILDAAGVRPGSAVLDVACGTGVLFPFYLSRGAARVTGVDLSPEMAKAARNRAGDARIQVLCGDMETIRLPEKYDCCVVYNAFPHFPDPAGLVAKLAGCLKPGGRLTVAHGMSLAQLRCRHAGSAAQVSREMLSAEELSRVFSPYFTVDTAVSDEEKYVVSGVLRGEK